MISSDAMQTQIPWHALPVEESLKRAESALGGITDAEAEIRLSRHGPNVLRVTPPVAWWIILAGQFKSVFTLLLIVAAALGLLIGDPKDAVAIVAVLVLNVILGFVTEFRARRAVEALRALEVQHATVVRAGHVHEIDARTLVPGDVVQLEAGYAVPADARLLRSTELRALEAALTGESLPVDKFANDVISADTPLPERDNMTYLGTSVVAGTGLALVVATGADTEVGRIGVLVSGIRTEHTPLERRLDTLGRQLAVVAVVVAALIAVINLVQGIGLATVVRTGIAVAIAAVPEGLPAVVTIAMAIGVHRMARRHALVRRLPTVESLGSATVVCTDKTGTLTTGDMTVTTLSVADREIRVTGTGYTPEGRFLEGEMPFAAGDDPDVATALRIAALANRADLTRVGDRWEVRGDPTDAALLVAASKAGVHRAVLLEQWPETGELPFSSERMLMATYHRTEGERLEAHVKGSPSHVLELCDFAVTQSGEQPLDIDQRRALLERNDALAARGLRVLALAHGVVNDTGERDLHGLSFIGFAGMIDAPAPGVPETIRRLREAGIRTVMLTGDQRRTAEAIATSLGIMGMGTEALDGRDVDKLSDGELTARVGHVAAYSRLSPEAKLRIVAALQERGEVVAMLGDGVNDAAALKKADVGVAMGRRGTDAAKEAAGVVLEDDRFATIAAAVEEGRVIFDNIRKFVFYLFSCNLAEIIVLLGAGLTGLPLPLLPLQILWLNLVTDTFPALALAFEPADVDVMNRPPRDPRSGILSPSLLRATAAYSGLIGGCVLAAFVLGLRAHPESPRHAVTMAFMTVALAQLFHLGNARSRASVLAPRRAMANSFAVGAVVLAILLQVFALYLAPLRDLLDLVPLSVTEWSMVLGLSIVPGLIGQAAKYRVSTTGATANPDAGQTILR
jgi:Ca2+-transporting ATPase